MKTLKLILVLAIFSYCFTDTFNCEEEFENLLKQKCEEIDSCSYNPNDPNHRCVETHECGTGNSSYCARINPQDYLSKKCFYDGSSCTSIPRQCGNYITNSIIGNSCESLSVSNPNEQRCILTYGTYGTGNCEAHYKDCSKASQSKCNTNIPELSSKKCEWSTSCNPVDRYCGDGDKTFVNFFGKDECNVLQVTGMTDEEKTKKKCIYDGGICKEVLKECESYTSVHSEDDCNNYMPLKVVGTNKYDYDYEKICTYISDSGICNPRKRKCLEYSSELDEILSDNFCKNLDTSETYYRCTYNEETNRCKEEYRSCDAYINNKVETDRSNCEDIVLEDKTKTCVYNQKDDTCTEIVKYSTCGEYKEKDKKICESILSSENNQYCILDKDSECIEKPINCTEALDDEEMCLKIAKSTDSNKRCAFGYTSASPLIKMCYEEYIRCEDYIGNSQSECEKINLYDGKKCEWETNTGAGTTLKICRSTFKTCSNAKTKEECKLIARTGVTDPDRKVCDWDGSSCFENYKYCSDYRGTDPNVCKKIKPYDESGDNVDIGFKCFIDNDENVGCEKVPVECGDAGHSRSLCESYSQYIKDNDKKFCVYDDNSNSCKSYYRKCEYIKHSEEVTSSCTNNIIEGYIIGACELDDTGTKCVTKNICSKLASTYSSKRDYFVKRINPNCSYSYSSLTSSNIFKYGEKTCKQTTFYTNSANNKEICESMMASTPYKKCILKEDGSACDEVYREFNYSTAGISYSRAPDNVTQENSSHFIEKGMHLFMALICLLI